MTHDGILSAGVGLLELGLLVSLFHNVTDEGQRPRQRKTYSKKRSNNDDYNMFNTNLFDW